MFHIQWLSYQFINDKYMYNESDKIIKELRNAIVTFRNYTNYTNIILVISWYNFWSNEK